jgi:hypothetical protein
MSGGMVRVMDHDCAWVGCCIGEGNHRAFLAMAISGELALLLCAHALLLHLAQRGGVLRLLRLALASTHATAAAVVHARLLLLVTLLCALLLLLLTPLLFGQVCLKPLRIQPATLSTRRANLCIPPVTLCVQASLVAYNLTTVEFMRIIRTQAPRPTPLPARRPSACCRAVPLTAGT